MSDLEEAFGSEFVEQFQQERQRRRAERQRIEDEEMAKICALAINENKFDATNPIFTYISDTGMNHDVALVTVPDPDERSYWSLKNDGNEGSVQLPLEFMGDWMWSWFNDREIAKKLEPGEEFIVAGRIDTWERDDGSEQDTFSPVRGVTHLQQAMEWADMALEGEGIDVPEQPGDEEPVVMENTEDSSSEESTDSEAAESAFEGSEEEEERDESDNGGTFSELLDEQREEEEETEEEAESLVDYDDVQAEVSELAENEPKVWEVDEESPALLDKLVNMIGNRLEYETNEEGAIQNPDVAEEIRKHSLRAIDEHNEQEGEEEEENLF